MADKPAAEIEVTEELVRALLREQQPDLTGLPLELVAEGWDNAIWRLGDALAVRVPRRELAVQLVLNEQQWLPLLAPALPVPVPVPVRTGSPGPSFAWPWSVVPWVAGRHAIELDRAETGGLVAGLADFVTRLHVPAPPEAPVNPFRGIPLVERDAILRGRVPALPRTEQAAALAVWEDALAAHPWPGPPVWLHGDLHPGNIVVSDDGSLASVVDFGDLCSGDPAVDLAAAWYLWGPDDRARFVELVSPAYPEGESLWRRARAWALSFATALLTMSDDNPEYLALGRRTLATVLEP